MVKEAIQEASRRMSYMPRLAGAKIRVMTGIATICWMLASLGIMYLFMFWLQPVFDTMPNGRLYWIAALVVTWMIVAAMFLILKVRAVKSYMMQGITLLPLATNSTEPAWSNPVAMLEYPPVTIILILFGILLVVMILDNIGIFKSPWLNKKYEVEW